MRRHAPATATSVALFLSAAVASAAEVTDVQDANEPGNPWDVRFDVGWRRAQDRSKITREHFQEAEDGSSTVTEVTELRLTSITSTLDIGAAFGLWQDLELHIRWPLVLGDETKWRYAIVDGQSVEPTSTIKNNCTTPDGNTIAGCPEGTADPQPLFPVPGESHRGSWADPTFGLSWGIFNDAREPFRATWVVTFDYTAPIAPLNKPGIQSKDKPGDLGEKAHRFTFATAFSKRIKIFDPYIRLFYALPVASDGAYDNCDEPDRLPQGAVDHCQQDPWRGNTGLDPAHDAGLRTGTEIVVHENVANGERVAFDIGTFGTYHSQGRTYTELSDPLGKLLHREESVTLGGRLGFTGRAARALQFNAWISYAHDTPHDITGEKIGKDLNGSDQVELATEGDGEEATPEQNPNFDFRYDLAGRRFRVEEQQILAFYLGFALLF